MNLGLLTLLPGIRLATLCNNFRRFCLCYYIHFCLGVYETWEVEENTHLMLLYHQRSLLVLIIACAVGLSVTFICPNFPFYCHRWNRWQQSRIMLFFFFLLQAPQLPSLFLLNGVCHLYIVQVQSNRKGVLLGKNQNILKTLFQSMA